MSDGPRLQLRLELIQLQRSVEPLKSAHQRALMKEQHMTQLRGLPTDAPQAPKTKSRKKLVIITCGLAILAAIIIAVIATLSDAGSRGSVDSVDSVLVPKPDAPAIVNNYLQALSEGNGEDALKYIDPIANSGLDGPVATKILSEASGFIEAVKVGSETGMAPQQSDNEAGVRAIYSLSGRESTVDFHLSNGPDGWLISDPEIIKITVPIQEIGPKDGRANLDFTATAGSTLVMTPGTTANLFPAEYPITYTGNKNFNFNIGKFSETVNHDFVGFNLEAVGATIEKEITKYINDCMASGQTRTILDGQECGFSSVSFPATLAEGLQTDTSDWTLTSAPKVTLTESEAGKQRWEVDFAATAHRIMNNTQSPTAGVDENVSRELHCGGQWGYTAQGEPRFVSANCDDPANIANASFGIGNGSMTALLSSVTD